MPSVFVVKEKLEAPMEWYTRTLECGSPWEYDETLKSYHAGDIYLREGPDRVTFEDTAEEVFFAWETSDWIDLAEGRELIYGYYSEDSLSAEYVHVKGGACVREFREYDGAIEANEGETPEFEGWVDIAAYIDEHLL